MKNKKPLDVKSWKINGFPIHLEHYDSMIIFKDENGNSMKISKYDRLSVILNLNGSFKSE